MSYLLIFILLRDTCMIPLRKIIVSLLDLRNIWCRPLYNNSSCYSGENKTISITKSLKDDSINNLCLCLKKEQNCRIMTF